MSPVAGTARDYLAFVTPCFVPFQDVIHLCAACNACPAIAQSYPNDSASGYFPLAESDFLKNP